MGAEVPERRPRAGLAVATVLAGPAVAVGLALAWIALLNWVWPKLGSPVAPNLFWAAVPVLPGLGVAWAAGAVVTARGLARLGVRAGWSRWLLAALVVGVGVVVLGLVGWLTGGDITSGSSS